MHFGMRLFEQRAIVTCDAPDHVRIDADAVIRKNRERRDMFDQFHIRSAQRQGQIGRKRRGNAKARQEPRRDPRILAEDPLDTAQHRERAQSHITKIADRRGHEIKTRRELDLGRCICPRS